MSFYTFGMFNGMWRYTSLIDMGNIFKANFIGTLLLIAGIGYFRGFHDIPRAILIIDFILTFSFSGLSRIGVRLVYSHLINPKPFRIALNKRVIIIGAGATGEFICKELLNDSLMLVTALAPKIGYDKAASIAKTAHKNGTTLKHEVIKTGLIKEKEYDKIMSPLKNDWAKIN